MISVPPAKLRHSKMLYLCKNDSNVIEYSDSLKDFERVEKWCRYLKEERALRIRLCEYLKLKNNVELWQCYVKKRAKKY